jgi:hypothetical protein
VTRVALGLGAGILGQDGRSQGHGCMVGSSSALTGGARRGEEEDECKLQVLGEGPTMGGAFALLWDRESEDGREE